jgi:anti-anti-sigma factor
MTTGRSFGLEITGIGATRVLRARGRLVAGAGADASVWAAAGALGHADQVLVDLRDVTAIDARGVGRLVSLRQALARHGVGVTVWAAGPRVRRVLHLTGLDAIFGIASGAAPGNGPTLNAACALGPLCRCA